MGGFGGAGGLLGEPDPLGEDVGVPLGGVGLLLGLRGGFGGCRGLLGKLLGSVGQVLGGSACHHRACLAMTAAQPPSAEPGQHAWPVGLATGLQ